MNTKVESGELETFWNTTSNRGVRTVIFELFEVERDELYKFSSTLINGTRKYEL